jgi:hypothetical protein
MFRMNYAARKSRELQASCGIIHYSYIRFMSRTQPRGNVERRFLPLVMPARENLLLAEHGLDFTCDYVACHFMPSIGNGSILRSGSTFPIPVSPSLTLQCARNFQSFSSPTRNCRAHRFAHCGRFAVSESVSSPPPCPVATTK